ncbi:MAG TPA: TetR/AcrR family transcriptional regulator [Chloroflexota bacterium]|nr:TetR/AcrR family transcriptional regulator [Chloroflexota bacterium]HUM70614.1 TetR/AcrR family transcriptional regulator [Chloroflexota bacterium]
MQDRSVATINNILDAARTLFTEKQYADVSLREITEAAGVTKGALYHHFATKEELYLQTVYRCLDEVKETIQDSMRNSRGESCRNRLHLSLASFLRLPFESLSIMRSIRRNINVFQEPVRTELIRTYQAALPEQIELLLREGMTNGEVISMDARLLSWQHVAVVEVSLHEYGRERLGGPDEMADSIVSLFFNGIEKPKNS